MARILRNTMFTDKPAGFDDSGGDCVVRFKVIKGSQLLLGIAVALLVAVIAALALICRKGSLKPAR